MPDAFRAKVCIGNLLVELEGSEQFVRDELEFLKKTLIQRLDTSGLDKAVPQTEAREKGVPAGKVPIKQFVEGKPTKNDMEKAAIAAYYVATHEDTSEIDGDTLSSWFTKAGWRPPKNPPQTLNDAIRRKGYFDSVESGKYKLSDTGRYFVEHEWGAA